MRRIIQLPFSAYAFLALTATTFAQNIIWRDAKGNPAPDTEFRRSKNGFGGWLLVTPDTDWQKKWETSPEIIPHFNGSDTVERGKQLFILTFFSNPKTDSNGTADVTCDIDVTRPNGTSSVHQVDAICFRGKLEGDASNVRLSAPILSFTGEPNDPAGKWTVRVILKDNQRQVALPLTTSFTLQQTAAKSRNESLLAFCICRPCINSQLALFAKLRMR